MDLSWLVGIVLAIFGAMLLSKKSGTPSLNFSGSGVRWKSLLLILTVSIVVSTALFLLTDEDWTLSNVVTVYLGIFGAVAIVEGYLR